jgi:cation-transporting ATPase 13A2
VGRTLPYPRIFPKPPTASLVSKKVLSSIIGQIVITSAVQFWAFFWVRDQDWYTPPNIITNPAFEDDHLQAMNYENSALFLISCFQYILVAAVFSIGPPYRKSIWTNGAIVSYSKGCMALIADLGWLMFSIVTLTLFNLLVLVHPPQPVRKILELMVLPFSARMSLLFAVILNVALSMAFEEWGTQVVAQIIGALFGLRRDRRRSREGKVYKAVEGGMR